jgi:segregation and condensation protein B
LEDMETQPTTSLKRVVESLIFAADEPITAKQIRELIESDSADGYAESEGVLPQKLRALVDELNDEYDRESKPYHIQAVAGGYIFATNKDVSSYVSKLHREQSRRRLTQAALETLAIIAYKQPITKVELETVRGVQSDYIIKSLLEKDLISIVGRQQTVGRPLLYGTTNRFLIHFGLNSLNELPKPREIEELIGETELEVEKRLLELEKQKQEEQEESLQKRERKPHPLSDGVTAKIIPLKPEYRPDIKIKKQVREESKEIEEPEDERQTEIDGKKVFDEPEEREKKETGEATEESDTTADLMIGSDEDETKIPHVQAETDEQQDYPQPEPVQIEEISIPVVDEHSDHKESDTKAEEEIIESGWKKWKNKIVKIIKKIFG